MNSDSEPALASPEVINWLRTHKTLDAKTERIVQEWQDGKSLNLDDILTVSEHTGVPFGYLVLEKIPDEIQKPPTNELEYRGLHTHIHYDANEEVLYGEIEGIKKKITFQSENAMDIKRAFCKAVNEYLYAREKEEERER